MCRRRNPCSTRPTPGQCRIPWIWPPDTRTSCRPWATVETWRRPWKTNRQVDTGVVWGTAHLLWYCQCVFDLLWKLEADVMILQGLPIDTSQTDLLLDLGLMMNKAEVDICRSRKCFSLGSAVAYWGFLTPVCPTRNEWQCKLLPSVVTVTAVRDANGAIEIRTSTGESGVRVRGIAAFTDHL